MRYISESEIAWFLRRQSPRFLGLYFAAVLHRDGAQHLYYRPPVGDHARNSIAINDYVTVEPWSTYDRYVPAPDSELISANRSTA